MQDEEVLTSLVQTVRMDNETHSYSSTLGGPTGRAVERFRRQCQEEYLDTLEHCQRHNLPISKATLQRGTQLHVNCSKRIGTFPCINLTEGLTLFFH